MRIPWAKADGFQANLKARRPYRIAGLDRLPHLLSPDPQDGGILAEPCEYGDMAVFDGIRPEFCRREFCVPFGVLDSP